MRCVKKALFHSILAEVMKDLFTKPLKQPLFEKLRRKERWGCAESKMYIKKMKFSPKQIYAEFSLREGRDTSRYMNRFISS